MQRAPLPGSSPKTGVTIYTKLYNVNHYELVQMAFF